MRHPASLILSLSSHSGQAFRIRVAASDCTGGSQRLYLSDSVVAFVAEVKSNLTDQWPEVERSVVKVRPLRRFWRGHLNVAGASLGIRGPSESRVPFVAVGFRGYGTAASLADRVNGTEDNRRPDAALGSSREPTLASLQGDRPKRQRDYSHFVWTSHSSHALC
jgi:hypothetical protein